MTTKYTFGALAPEYARRWAAMQIKPAKVRSLDAVARKIIAGKAEYQRVEVDTGVPWAVVGVLHNREASCDFNGILHNGEKILGTGRKTRLVPKGRGPFKTWHEAALDAIAIKGWDKNTVWSIEFFLFASEVFNGMGYRAHGVPSAYLWSFSDQYLKGKYVADHDFNPDVVDQQMGVAPLMKRLFILDPSADFTSGATPAADAAPDDPSDSVTINLDDGLSEGEVLALQQRLRDLGYSEVGRPDGLWGPKTTAAVSAFQATAGLPVSGELDKTTAAALATSGPRPVSDARAKTTATDLRKAGDPVAEASFLSKVYSAVAGFFALIFGAAQQSGAAVGYLSPVREFVTDVPPVAWFGAVAVLAAIIWWQANRAERAAVADVRSGRDAGPL
ncbi:peptidoglycan-binding protein [Xanthobacter flavus]|uniref:peptidoglycan-binding protein n=1 Tax=Xanthobacter flavus TaxID=281 RepID=UPI0037294570